MRTYLLIAPGSVRTDMGGVIATLSVEESIAGVVETITTHAGRSGLSLVDTGDGPYRGDTAEKAPLDLTGGMSAAVTSRSRATFSETVELLLSSIAQAGGMLFATIDQRAAAETVGLVLRPTTLLIFGNPKGGTPLMEAYPLAALDLPLKVLVWEDDTGVFVSYVPIDTLAARYGVLGHEKLLANFERTLANVVGAVV